MIKLETHLHCKGGSDCATVTADEIVEEYSNLGYGGLVLTNHFNGYCYNQYKGETHREKISFYLSLYNDLKEKASKLGIKVFFGCETFSIGKNGVSEFMFYGMDEKFMLENPPFFDKPQKELFEIANENGFFMYQTHPFRQGIETGDPRYLHGAEVFNGNFNQINHNDLAFNFAHDNNLIMMSGSDHHTYQYPIKAGIYIPEDIETNKDLATYLLTHQPKLIMD